MAFLFIGKPPGRKAGGRKKRYRKLVDHCLLHCEWTNLLVAWSATNNGVGAIGFYLMVFLLIDEQPGRKGRREEEKASKAGRFLPIARCFPRFTCCLVSDQQRRGVIRFLLYDSATIMTICDRLLPIERLNRLATIPKPKRNHQAIEHSLLPIHY
jgi:hypothetical protein